MKPYRFFLFLSAVLVFTAFSQPSFSQTFQPGRTPLEIQLSSLPQVTEVLRLESSTFDEKYRIRVRQMVNHEDIIYGFFEQRVFVMHAGTDRPTVLVTEG